MAATARYILGIDPGLRSTGFGLIEQSGSKLAYVASGCIKTDDECAVAPAETGDTRVLAAGGQTTLTLQTPAAAKDCHATFDVVAAYTGDDLYDPDLPQPQLIASANAVGVLGEQPGGGLADSALRGGTRDDGNLVFEQHRRLLSGTDGGRPDVAFGPRS